MRPNRGFTLVEMLVVLLIVALVSAATLPTIIPALSHRQVSESARILQAAIEGARDAAIRANAPSGIRLVPDPTFPGGAAGTNAPLAYNRILALEPAPDYSEGRASILDPTAFPNPPATGAGAVPIPYSDPAAAYPPDALRIEECRRDAAGLANPRVNWWWNVRVGERIRVGTAGRPYTIVGPMVILPGAGNPEGFINIGPPGTASPLRRDYGTVTDQPVEFLYVTDGRDGDGDGLADNGWMPTFTGWDGLDSDGDGSIDETTFDAPFDRNGDGVVNAQDGPNLPEWEVETWHDSEARGLGNSPYTISRRPYVAPGARTIDLPANVVIDATTWDSTRERSRLPIDPNSLYVDILISPNGTAIPPASYAPQALVESIPFFHFWLTERTDVLDPRVTPGVSYRLPMPEGSPGYPAAADATGRILAGDRRLVTLFTKTGLVVTNEMEDFDGGDVKRPFYSAQMGTREAR